MNRPQLVEMLVMQDRINNIVDPTWLTSNYPWHRAIMVESVEALDHYGWKWWKHNAAHNVAQIQLELVDIWHFALSLVLDRNNGERELTVEMLVGFFGQLEADPNCYGEVTGLSVPELFDLMAGTAGASQMLNGSAFLELMKRFNLSWDGLYQLYMGKNVLNLFRQANGYKDGSYIKTWDGVEDNVVLASLISANPGASADRLMELLDRHYAQITVPTPIEP